MVVKIVFTYGDNISICYLPPLALFGANLAGFHIISREMNRDIVNGIVTIIKRDYVQQEKNLTLALLAAGLTLGLIACSDDDNTSQTTEPPVVTPPPARLCRKNSGTKNPGVPGLD
ncbi:hypothetical protein ACRTDR_14985 [Shewanella algae]